MHVMSREVLPLEPLADACGVAKEICKQQNTAACRKEMGVFYNVLNFELKLYIRFQRLAADGADIF